MSGRQSHELKPPQKGRTPSPLKHNPASSPELGSRVPQQGGIVLLGQRIEVMEGRPWANDVTFGQHKSECDLRWAQCAGRGG